MPGHSLCDSDGLQHQTSRPLGRPSLVADHLYRSSLSSPDPRTNPSPVRHISDWTHPPPSSRHWPVWFVCDSYLHPISSVPSFDFGPLRVVSGGLFVVPFFLCDLTPVVLINVRSSVTCTSLIYILWHVANLLLSFYLRLSLPIGIDFSMWDFFFTWDRKFLTFYLNLSIIINYYTFFSNNCFYFFFYAIY